jgi:hypothetical protein
MVLDIEISSFDEFTSEGEELWWQGWAHATLQLDWPTFYREGLADGRTINVFLTTVGVEEGMVQMWIPCPPWVVALGPAVPNWCFGPMHHGPLAVRVPVVLRPRRFSIEAHSARPVCCSSAAHLLLILVSSTTHLPLIWTHLA